ncbi:MAG: BlaI/MecI/CopY family transcriptional regulator [Bacteroidia bacterium]|nr:BlaI/MecI/CopY family transcriptional regulator [Bacteroidia bacterium]
MKELTKSEEQVMQVIWKIGRGFANEIMTAFPEPKPAYNTVLTMVRILEKKGFVGHETFCKANRYFPLISKEEYSQNSLKVLVSNYFNGSYTELVSAFTKKENFTLEQLQELKMMIEDVIEEES